MDAVTLFNFIFATLFAIIVGLQVYLHFSVKRSLFLYRNVACISIMLFLFVLMLELYSYLVMCLQNTKSLTVYYILMEFRGFPDKFAHIALPFFIIICSALSISNLALIRHEGMRLTNILGIFLGAIFIGGSVLNFYFNTLVENLILTPGSRYNTEINKVIHTYLSLFFVLLICYLEVVFTATVIMAYLATRQKPAYDKDYIIILGCKVDKKGGLLPILRDRTNRAIKYAWEQEIKSGKPVKYVPSGGQGPGEVISEGSAIELYLLSHGAEAGEVFAEKESRNTYENFLYSKKLIDALDEDAKICFTTTNYHMYRSGLIARRVGIENIEGVASRAKWYFWPNGFVREFIAILMMEKKMHMFLVLLMALACVLLGFISYYI